MAAVSAFGRMLRGTAARSAPRAGTAAAQGGNSFAHLMPHAPDPSTTAMQADASSATSTISAEFILNAAAMARGEKAAPAKRLTGQAAEIVAAGKARRGER